MKGKLDYNREMKSISIDSTKIDELSVQIQNEEKIIKKVQKAKNIRGSQVILLTIDRLLKEAKISLEDIERMYIHMGTGSYTGLRVGAAIANTIAFCLEIPVNDKKSGEFVYPSYQ